MEREQNAIELVTRPVPLNQLAPGEEQKYGDFPCEEWGLSTKEEEKKAPEVDFGGEGSGEPITKEDLEEIQAEFEDIMAEFSSNVVQVRVSIILLRIIASWISRVSSLKMGVVFGSFYSTKSLK